MTREKDPREGTWTMRCDEDDCGTRSKPAYRIPELVDFHRQGWFIAKLYGDVCPTCQANGARPTATPFDFGDAT